MRDANLDTSNIYETERAEASRGLGGAMGAASLSRRTVLRGAGVAALAKVDAIPVGGAILVKDAAGKPVILSQPTAGTVVAMTAICTHQGCTVAPAGAQLVCPCHGSVYKSADGSNVSGPAPKPLAAVTVHVVNGEVLPG